MYGLGVTETARDERDEYAEWRRSMFGEPYLVWHDGADFGELLRRAGSGEAQARRVGEMLALGLRGADPLAARSIAALAGDGVVLAGAEALLRDALVAAEDTPDTFLLAVARALRVLTGDEAWVAPIIRVLAEGSHWSSRIDAALALREVDPTPGVLDALTRAMTNPEYLVRYHAAETMLSHAYRTNVDISSRSALFAKICNKTDSGPADWQHVAQTLAAECTWRIERRRAAAEASAADEQG